MHNILDLKLSLKNILKFAFPSMLMMLFLSFYIMVDGVFISHYIGREALAASNIVYPVMTICWAVSLMLAMGGSALVSRQMGEGKAQLAKETFSAIVYFGIIVSVLLALGFYLFLDDVIYFLGANEKLFPLCKEYISVSLFFFPMMMLQVLFQNFLVARGRPKYGMQIIFLAGGVNMLFDYIFIGIFGWGLRGAMLATGLGFSTVAIFGLIYFAKNRVASLYFTRPNTDYKAILESMVNGSSEMVNQFATALIIFLFNRAMMTYVGEVGVASISIILYLQFFLVALFLGYAGGVAPLFSFNLGKGDYGNIKRLFGVSFWACVVAGLLVFSLCWILEDFLVGFFVKDAEVYAMTKRGLRYMSFSFLFAGFNILASALFTALSNGKVSAFLSFSRSFLFLAPFILCLPIFLGEAGVWLSIPFAEFIFFMLTVSVVSLYRKRYRYF